MGLLGRRSACLGKFGYGSQGDVSRGTDRQRMVSFGSERQSRFCMYRSGSVRNVPVRFGSRVSFSWGNARPGCVRPDKLWQSW